MAIVRPQVTVSAASGYHSGDARALAEKQLRAASVRITAARVEVLAALLNARCAFSHQDLQDSLAGMDRVTLYRALDCLTDAQLAHKIAGDDRVYRYSAGAELAGCDDKSPARDAIARHPHGHFKCTRCARVFCLDGSARAPTGSVKESSSRRQSALHRQLRNLLQETLGIGFQSHDVDLTIKGWCSDCTH